MNKLISIIIPTYNEEKNIEVLYNVIVETLMPLAYQYDFEIIFIDDGSLDRTSEIIQKIAVNDARIKFIKFSRNFGKEMATSAGLDVAAGEAAIMIDADLQHPPKEIPVFIEKWEKGAEVVVGIRKANRSEGLVKKIGSYWFYKIINSIGYVKLIPYATDFRLIDREVIDTFNTLSEKNRITRGLIDWMGYRSAYLYFHADERIRGSAGYSVIKLIRLAFTSIVSLSLFPLRLAGYLGLIITSISGLFGFAVFIFRYIFPTSWGLSISGTATLAIIILFLVGIILICLGLIALYIANIHSEVINRPKYIIRKKR